MKKRVTRREEGHRAVAKRGSPKKCGREGWGEGKKEDRAEKVTAARELGRGPSPTARGRKIEKRGAGQGASWMNTASRYQVDGILEQNGVREHPAVAFQRCVSMRRKIACLEAMVKSWK